MNEKWRLLDTGLDDAFSNMALDEAIVMARSKNLVPNTLRFFRWNPSAVSIGYFQGIEEEVDVKACDERHGQAHEERVGHRRYIGRPGRLHGDHEAYHT